MKTPSTTRAALTVLGAAAMLWTGAAPAALLDRDLDKNGVTDAFYDTDLDITWLRDANVNGLAGWSEAASWAAGFSIGIYGDWRLPTVDLACSSTMYCTGGEFGHLWYGELGNTAGGPMTNTGGFQNLQLFWYWSGNEIPASSVAYAFDVRDGRQGTQFTASNRLYAMAVSDGDVGMVPEPETYVLMLAGLAGVIGAARRRLQAPPEPK